jgi:acetolactate synthase-1/3 small subunit
VGHTELPGKSRFTIVTTGDDTVLEQVRKQLQKLVHVIKAWDIKQSQAVEREHALLKIEVEDKRRAELLQIITAVQGRIVDSSGSIWILEVTGDTGSVDNAFNLFMDYRILESIRTGKIALERGPSLVMKK